ncbi:MAG: DUF4167 domain-containing protein [Alphaproteobacteria bacterium]|nr:DUF4167 domain-containing protein [Alphaproteobacteria bacterium]
MRHGTSTRRQRGRGNGGRRANSQRMQVFDSNGPDVRIRGTAHQVAEKYVALAKDSAAAGDQIMAESYLQHAEHYQRIINSWNEDVQERSVPRDVREDLNIEQDDDLSLPSSILGASSKVKSSLVSGECAAEMAAG